MKKLSVYIMAIASMGIAMTSCNKEENTVAEPITVTLEENEILNDAKVHQVGETYTYYWDEGDQIRFIDQNGYAAIYKATRMAPRAEFDFVQNVNTSRPFDRSNGPIIGIYPWNVGVNAGEFTMPKVQNSVAGELYKDFPLYAEQPLNPSYEFKNLCGVAKIVVSGDVAIDSISVTTDQVINGDFRIDMTDPNNPVISPVQPNGHGTKTITLKVENPEVPAAKAYKIAMPPAEYKTFVITFYAGNTQFVKRYQNISIIRTAYTTLNINTPLSGANFSANPVGTINGAFSVSASQTVRFAKGNLQYVAVKGHPFWHIADNQWDYLDVINQRQGYGGDRDLISWGANRYNVANNNVAGNTGNSYAIWNRVGTYNYLPGTDALAGINEWGNNAIENGGNAANLWRTLTAAEWDYLLNTRSGDRFLNAELTIGAMTVKGLIIFPDGYSTNYAGVNNATEASVAIAMSDWFNMEADGCVFLPINTYGRDVNAQAHFPENSGSMSYYWTATPDSDTEANAIKLSKTTGMNAEVIAKRCGAFIDYVVPSRIHHGEFYALPQSPQQYKQLLMVAGIDRYYQIVKCFRDEDLRADRQPEFTQIDCEMSFVEQEDVLQVFEGLAKHLFKEVRGIEMDYDFPRITWHKAMEEYGSDKPDIRFGMKIHNITDAVKGHNFKVFDDAEYVCAIAVGGCANYSRKQLDELTEWVKRPQVGAKGLVYIKYNEDNTIKSSVDKFYTPEQLTEIAKMAGAGTGDLVLILCGKKLPVLNQMGTLRIEMANRLNLRDKNIFAPLWVIDFPLFEWDDATQRFYAMHHPFTSPKKEDYDILESNPGEARANAYDLVINGVEVGGGSIRIHDSALQVRMFKLLGFTEEKAQEQFSCLINAFKYGAPPHGGLAFGLDRWAALMNGSDTIKDVIAFPKNNAARDVMIDAPSRISDEQLDELSLIIKPEKANE